MTKTFKELREIDEVVGTLYKQYPDIKKTKFGYAYEKFYKKNFVPVLDEVKDELELVYAEHALEDKTTKAVVLDINSKRGYAYSKEGLKAVINAEKEVFEKANNKEIELITHISAYIPEELNDDQKELLSGIVI